ncbi:Cupredoxin [Mycena sp. CBHHK59/15]|nr:Cupredoxin [Mycena sp. CBHHK59/15]
MTIIEVDGWIRSKYVRLSHKLYAGQRYSVVLTANQVINSYWIRAVPDAGPTGFANGMNLAILRYIGAAQKDPTSVATTPRSPLLETDLHPLIPVPVPGAPFPGLADITLNLEIDFDCCESTYSINGATYTPPSEPVLLQILSGASGLVPSGSIYRLPRNSAIEISITGGSDGAPHPFHLHGHNFHVIKSAGNDTFNFNDPVIRDVVSTGASPTDHVVIRFLTNNAGPWLFRCQNEFHFDSGLAIIFAEDTPDIIQGNQSTTISPGWVQLCHIYDSLGPSQL